MWSVSQWLALACTALIVFAIANYFPIVTLRLKWLIANASLPQALMLTWEQGRPVVAVMTGLFGFLVPLTQLLFLVWALMCVASGNLPRDFAMGMRVLRVLGTWSMVPVLMLGILVAIVKLAGLAVLHVAPGLWGFVALTVLLTLLERVSAGWLWRQAEDAGLVPLSGIDVDPAATVASCHACGNVQNLASPHDHQACRRCGAKVRFRLPGMSRTWALVLAACILYVPANVLPVMKFRTPVGTTEHTILGGVVELWKLGSWDLAIIVFVASIVVPMTKLLILIALMARRCWLGDDIQRQRTRLYELVEFIGQWSMLDVFVVILLTSMANFPGISQISAGPGAASFGLVVVLTMLASAGFDPRHGWDARPSLGSSDGRKTAVGGERLAGPATEHA
ncbi:MAG TPA: paraquat-inducible protein A [Burkholderiaceae bacterium]|nr:paraquat-inducible protein A [Burkholderiaceae bacterium]